MESLINVPKRLLNILMIFRILRQKNNGIINIWIGNFASDSLVSTSEFAS